MVEWIAMKDLFSIKNGYTPSKNRQEYWDGGTIPWFRMEDIRQNGTILKDSIQHITPLGVKKGGLFPANSIIVATTATIGEHALIIVDSLANQQFTFLTKCKSYDSKLDMKYMYYYMFVVDEWCKKNTNVSGFASVDMDKFKKLLIPIPSLSEQNRIVSILDTFTSSIDNLKAQIAQRRKQFEFYRDQLLDLEGKDGVEMKTLGEICCLQRGVRVVKKDLQVEGFIPVYQNSLTPLGFYDKSNFTEDTTFVICAGAAGEVGYSNIPFWAADDCTCIVCSPSICSKYVFHLLRSKQHLLKSHVRKASVPRLSKDVIGRLHISLPPLSEQRRIVTILDTFEASISNLEAQLAQRQKQYEYYRNQLLTFD